MDDKFKVVDCSDDDVLGFGDDAFKIAKLLKAMYQSVANTNILSSLSDELRSNGVNIDEMILMPNNEWEDLARWFGDGIDCEVLKLGSKEWRKGKVRIKISLEILVENNDAVATSSSNEPESPLDDIRRMIREENQ